MLETSQIIISTNPQKTKSYISGNKNLMSDYDIFGFDVILLDKITHLPKNACIIQIKFDDDKCIQSITRVYDPFHEESNSIKFLAWLFPGNFTYPIFVQNKDDCKNVLGKTIICQNQQKLSKFYIPDIYVAMAEYLTEKCHDLEFTKNSSRKKIPYALIAIMMGIIIGIVIWRIRPVKN